MARWDEIEMISEALHTNVVLPLLSLFIIVEFLVRQRRYEKSKDHFRYMVYRKRTREEHAKSEFGRTRGHADLGTVTLIFRQPVAGLQILREDGKWTYVSAQPGTITMISRTPFRTLQMDG